MQLRYVLSALFLVWVCMPYAAAADTITFDNGADCRKNTDRGCTGEEVKCYQSPADHIIMRSTLKVDTNPSGKSPRCEVSFKDMKTVSVTTSSGQKFDIT